jgi:hypothetical protein
MVGCSHRGHAVSAGDSLPAGKIGKKRREIVVVCDVCNTPNTFPMHYPDGEVICQNTKPKRHNLVPKP